MTAHADLSPTLQLAIDLIRRPSVTPVDADCQKQMMQRLGDAGFTLEPMRIEDVDNFWATHGKHDVSLVSLWFHQRLPAHVDQPW